MGDVRIANCIEMFHKEENSWKQTIDDFLDFAQEQGVGGEMAWHILGKPLYELDEKNYNEIIGYITRESLRKNVMWYGTHWLGAGIKDFCLTHPDETFRDFTAKCIADQCKALYQIRGEKEGGVAVVGSPFQRNLAVLAQKGQRIREEQAEEYFADTIARAVRYSEGTGVVIAPERLVYTKNEKALLGPIDGEGETDVCYSMEQAVRIANIARTKLTRGLDQYVKVMVDVKAATGSEESPVDAYNQIPEGLATYHCHIQGGNKFPPGYNDHGQFEGPRSYNLSPTVNFLAKKAADGEDVTLSIEAFKPFDEVCQKNELTIGQGFAQGNEHLRKLIKNAK